MIKDFFRKLTRRWDLPYSHKIKTLINSFSLTEKVIFYFLSVVLLLSGITLLFQVNKFFLVEVPDYGGTLTEGVVGSPRFINPLLATSDIDRDLTSLVYSGLLKMDFAGNFIPDVAEKYEISEDGLEYTVTLKDDVYFHDGVKLTADDVIFTVEKAQDPNLKSPRSGNWEGIKVHKVDEKTLVFVLRQQYSPFINNLTLGILPKHIWKNASIEEIPFSQFNTKPIGAGPYKLEDISYAGSGLPNEYRFKSYAKYSLGKAYITNLVIKSFSNEGDLIKAYKSGDIESMHSISPKQLPELEINKEDIILSPLPRIFGVFFNQNIAPVFVNKEVRVALDMATDKKAIIDSILGGYGKEIDGPIPTTSIESAPLKSEEERIKDAEEHLTKNGWEKNSDGIFQKKGKSGSTLLSFSISTGDAPELKETAILLQKQWQKLGALVEVKIFEIGDLNQNIIKTRKYDSLLFGEIIGRDSDLYPFWHSAARISPGLNIAMYTNIKADRILENIRKTTSVSEQKKLLNDLNQEIKNDTPAVFTYSPYFVYIVPDKVHNARIGALTYPGERFNDISTWYIETNNVWKIFRN
ncbi:MAG TPA: ABC transporter substrate-binding protein [Candidatus Paceibacterota bacterium]